MRQTDHYPHKLDRADIDHYFDQIELAIDTPLGPMPYEIALLRQAFKTNVPDTEVNDKVLASLLPTVRAFHEFTQADNVTDPRGFHQGNFYKTNGISTRVGLLQREMVRKDEAQKESGEWWFDQSLTMSGAGEPSFGLNFRTLAHGANGREPIVIREIEFWSLQEVPESVLHSLIGQPFGELLAKESVPRQFVGNTMDHLIVDQASCDMSLESEAMTFNLKLVQP
jgi:hypothetical protein